MNTKKTFKDLYSFPGFKAKARLKPHPNRQGAMVVTLNRCQKKRFVNVAKFIGSGMIIAQGLYETLTQEAQPFIWNLISAEYFAIRATQ